MSLPGPARRIKVEPIRHAPPAPREQPSRPAEKPAPPAPERRPEKVPA
jgi:hypothetical protein